MQTHEWVQKQNMVILWAWTIGRVRICVVDFNRDVFAVEYQAGNAAP